MKLDPATVEWLTTHTKRQVVETQLELTFRRHGGKVAPTARSLNVTRRAVYIGLERKAARRQGR